MLDPLPRSPFYLLVARAERAPRCTVWPAFFDRPLPDFPVPLARPDPDVSIALQPLVEAIYERGRYREEIDYSRPLDPELSPEERGWLEQQLRSAAPKSQPRRPKGRK
jgi:hypothetical protein